MHPQVLYRLGVHERGAVMPGLNMQLIRDLEIPLPPLAVQRRFEAAMQSVSDQRQAMTESLEQLDALFASLQHRAFRGEL
jgi:type I restriction enzyme S subunit